MTKKQQQPSGKPKEAPRAGRPTSDLLYISVHKRLAGIEAIQQEVRESLELSKSIALETRASLEQTSKVLAVALERLEAAKENTIAQRQEPMSDLELQFRVKALVKQYLQENPEWLRRADPPEAKMCGARYKGATCELRLGHTEWHGDRTAVKYWPLETSDAPESFPGPKAGQ
jgi:hypothetical protein